MKSEPNEVSIDHLSPRLSKISVVCVRNYQARNLMRDVMKVGDLAFSIIQAVRCRDCGICEVCSEAYPDESQFADPNLYANVTKVHLF